MHYDVVACEPVIYISFQLRLLVSGALPSEDKAPWAGNVYEINETQAYILAIKLIFKWK